MAAKDQLRTEIESIRARYTPEEIATSIDALEEIVRRADMMPEIRAIFIESLDGMRADLADGTDGLGLKVAK